SHKAMTYGWEMRANGCLCKSGCIYPWVMVDNKSSLGIIDVVLIGEKNHQRGCCTDKNGVNVHRECLHQALFCWVTYFCGRCSVRGGSLSGFIRIKPPFYPPRNGHSEDTSKERLQIESRSEY